MDISPRLRAIQSLPGSSPAAKHKYLDSLASAISSNEAELVAFLKNKTTDRLAHPVLLPQLTLMIAEKVESNELILTALMSDDLSVVKRASKAKWMFAAENQTFNVDYYKNCVFPFISYAARGWISKTMAKSLKSDKAKAEDFFTVLANDYDHKQALPILICCRRNFIYNELLRRKILMPSRLLRKLYLRSPGLVLAYLQLGDPRNQQNKDDRKKFSIDLLRYQHFLPQLVSIFSDEFATLCESLPVEKVTLHVGKKQAIYFVDSVLDWYHLLDNAKLYVKILKLEGLMLSGQGDNEVLGLNEDYERLVENLMPKEEKDFDLNYTLDLLRYYPEAIKSGFMQYLYSKLYSRHIMHNEKVIDCMPFLNLLGEKNKHEFLRMKVYENLDDPKRFYELLFHLDPQEVIRKIKVLIHTSTNLYYVMHMLKSCSFHGCYDYLLVVLQFYREFNHLENAQLFHNVFCYIINNFKLDKFDVHLWKELAWMVMRAFLKLFLLEQLDEAYLKFFTKALTFFKDYCAKDTTPENDQSIYDQLLRIVLVNYLKYNVNRHFVSHYTSTITAIEDELLSMFLTRLSPTESETRDIWINWDIKLGLITDLVKAMCIYNNKHFNIRKKKKFHMGKTVILDIDTIKQQRLLKIKMKQYSKMSIKNYPWIMEFSKELMKSERSLTDEKKVKSLRELRRLLRENDPCAYQSIIDEDFELINDVSSRDATDFLMHNHEKVLCKWQFYLNECRKLMYSGNWYATKFVTATRWYRDIPVRFAEKCIQEIGVKGSTLVLGILLEGNSLVGVVTPYLLRVSPANFEETEKLQNIISTFARAAKSTNPVVLFQDVEFYRKHRELAIRILFNASCRMPDKPLYKHLIMLVNQQIVDIKIMCRLANWTRHKNTVSSLVKTWDSLNSNDFVTRKTIFKATLDIFKQTLDEASFLSLIHFIGDLTACDAECFEMLFNFEFTDLTHKIAMFKNILFKLIQLTDKQRFNQDIVKIKQLEKIAIRFINKLDKDVMNDLPAELCHGMMVRYIVKYQLWHKLSCYLFSTEEDFSKKLTNIVSFVVKVLRKGFFNSCTHALFNQIVSILIEHDVTQTVVVGLTVMHGLMMSMTHPVYEPKAYMDLIVCKTYLLASTPGVFAERLSQILDHLVRTLGLANVTDNMAKIIVEVATKRKVVEQLNADAFEVVEGLMKHNQHVGSIVSIKLLKELGIKPNDKFAPLFDKWKSSSDVAICTALSLNFDNDFC